MNQRKPKTKSPCIVTGLEDSSIGNLTPGVKLCIESDAQHENCQIIHLNLKQNEKCTEYVLWFHLRCFLCVFKNIHRVSGIVALHGSTVVCI